MIHARKLSPQLAERLPKTHAILRSSNLTIHKNVSRIILHGSRGLADRCRPDSDIDLSLIARLPAGTDVNLLRDIYQTTMKNWRSGIVLDLAVVFESKCCGLRCFEHNEWNDKICSIGGVDCFGLFKIGKGFDGVVQGAGVQVRLMYPCLKIWDCQ